MFGYGGLHYSEAGLSIGASLPPFGVTELTLRGIAFAGGTVRLVVNGTHQTLSRTSGGQLSVAAAAVPQAQRATGSGKRMGAPQPLANWPSVTVLPLQRVELSEASSSAAV